MSVLTVLCVSMIPVALVALIVYFLFRVSSGEIDERYIENGNYTTDFSLCRHLDEKMLYYPAHCVGMKYLKVYMNIILPWLAVSRVLSVLAMGEEPLDLFYWIHISVMVLFLINAVLIRQIDTASFVVNVLAHAAFILEFVSTGGKLFLPITLVLTALNLSYFFRRKALFFTPLETLRSAYEVRHKIP